MHFNFNIPFDLKRYFRLCNSWHIEKFRKKTLRNCRKRRRNWMRFKNYIASYFIASVQPTTKFWKCQSINVEHKMHLFMMVAVPNGAKTLASAVKNLVIGKYSRVLILSWEKEYLQANRLQTDCSFNFWLDAHTTLQRVASIQKRQTKLNHNS